MMARWWLGFGSVAGALGVAGGAFGAHLLQNRISAEMLGIFDTGTRYLLVHAVALLVVGVLAGRKEAPPLRLTGFSFLTGMVVFTGSLWLLALTEMRWLGAITPIGGTAFIVGWASLARHAFGGRLSVTTESSSD